ncbi:hypothetical protein GCM10009410_38440 [Shewanella ulleungensis]|uniref:Uncharacterized protein n=1 Tax=Shewanella ulleungensis TaxID=2282699 RepID=A0ABQ2QWF9_9GAMM|nr:hypothetical protein GCM10009410_38440 [Shewanella ulleungensis]
MNAQSMDRLFNGMTLIRYFDYIRINKGHGNEQKWKRIARMHVYMDDAGSTFQ